MPENCTSHRSIDEMISETAEAYGVDELKYRKFLLWRGLCFSIPFQMAINGASDEDKGSALFLDESGQPCGPGWMERVKAAAQTKKPGERGYNAKD